MVNAESAIMHLVLIQQELIEGRGRHRTISWCFPMHATKGRTHAETPIKKNGCHCSRKLTCMWKIDVFNKPSPRLCRISVHFVQAAIKSFSEAENSFSHSRHCLSIACVCHLLGVPEPFSRWWRRLSSDAGKVSAQQASERWSYKYKLQQASISWCFG